MLMPLNSDYSRALAFVHSHFLPPQARPTRTMRRNVILGYLTALEIDRVRFFPRLIVVTGTNGKGTAVTQIEGAVLAAGVKTISVRSPHCFSVVERVSVDGQAITQIEFVRVVSAIRDLLERSELRAMGITPFEWLFMIALYLHAERGEDCVGIYEVGKGGLHDYTNIFQRPIVLLTNIGSDHLAEFGGTKESLLDEKLGLCHEGVRLIVDQAPAELLMKILQTATARNFSTNIVSVDEEKTATGSYGVSKSSVAEVMDSMGIECGESALSNHRQLPWRMQFANIGGKNFLLDGAHNPSAIHTLFEAIKKSGFVPGAAIFCLDSQKQLVESCQIINRQTQLRRVWLTMPSRGKFHSATTIVSHLLASTIITKNVREALHLAVQSSFEDIVVFGSFKLAYDFEYVLNAFNLRHSASPVLLDPVFPWMREI